MESTFTYLATLQDKLDIANTAMADITVPDLPFYALADQLRSQLDIGGALNADHDVAAALGGALILSAHARIGS